MARLFLFGLAIAGIYPTSSDACRARAWRKMNSYISSDTIAHAMLKQPSKQLQKPLSSKNIQQHQRIRSQARSSPTECGRASKLPPSCQRSIEGGVPTISIAYRMNCTRDCVNSYSAGRARATTLVLRLYIVFGNEYRWPQPLSLCICMHQMLCFSVLSYWFSRRHKNEV